MKKQWTMEKLESLEKDLISVLVHLENVVVSHFDPDDGIDTNEIGIQLEIGIDEIGQALEKVRTQKREIN